LQAPEDCKVLAESAQERCVRLVEDIAASINKPSAETLHRLDDVSNTLCRVLDTLELARNVHPEHAFVQAANDAYNLLSSTLHAVNTDDRLYKAVTSVLASPSVMASLTEEEQRFTFAMKSEFEHDGAHLSAESRAVLRDLQERASLTAASFVAASSRPKSSARRGLWVPEASMRGLGTSLHARLPKRDGRIFLPPDWHLLNTALCVCDEETTRRALLIERDSLGEGNLPLLDEMLSTRAQLAAAAGYSSYASFVASHERIERDPAAVATSLHTLLAATRPLAYAEVRRLRTVQPHPKGVGGVAPTTQHGDEEGIALHDQDYLIARYERAAAGESESAAHEARHYLELSECMRGLTLVLEKAFGLVLAPVVAREGEIWHRSVRKMMLYEAEGRGAGSPLGVLYLDLFPRALKTTNAALYTLRAGLTPRASSRSPRSAPSPTETHRPHASHALDADEEAALPAAALVCSLPQPRGAGCDDRTGRALLSPAQLRTLFHEVGHALHSLLARTEFQHFSGTRVPFELVEVPSTLLERFAEAPAVLCQWARHADSGVPMPRELARQLAHDRRGFEALRTQSTAMWALFDLQLHGEAAPTSPADTAAALHRLSQLTAVPLAPGTCPHGMFSHLGSYGSAYYSYLWARSVTLRLWYDCFEAEPLDGHAGRRWRAQVLRHGGAREPKELLRKMLASDSSARGSSRTNGLHFSEQTDVDKALLQLVDL